MLRALTSTLLLLLITQPLSAQQEPPEELFNHSSRDLAFRVPPEFQLVAQNRKYLNPAAHEVPRFERIWQHGSDGIVVSVVVWRDAASQRRDFEELGLSEYVSAYVTSLDVGWRKPHDAFFDAALAASGVPAEECAMVGDHEANDIVPAHARGMLTLQVSIEQPPPEVSVADHICESLAEVARLLGAS